VGVQLDVAVEVGVCVWVYVSVGVSVGVWVAVSVKVAVEVDVFVIVAVGDAMVTTPPVTGYVPCADPFRPDTIPIDDTSTPPPTSTWYVPNAALSAKS
jgi:hypothetical protein